jgi:hypothetical protein
VALVPIGRLDGEFEGGETEATVSARRYWPLASHFAFGCSASGRIVSGESSSTWTPPIENYITESESTVLGGALEVSLLGTFGRPGSGALWWTAAAKFTGTDNRFSANVGVDRFSSHYSKGDLRFTVGVAGRGRWGIARLEFSYVDWLW